MNKIPANVAPPAGPCCLVIFGASGDLTHRLLVPALYNHLLPGVFCRTPSRSSESRAARNDAFRSDLAQGLGSHRSNVHAPRARHRRAEHRSAARPRHLSQRRRRRSVDVRPPALRRCSPLPDERIALLPLRCVHRMRRSRQLQHGCVLAFAQPGEQHSLPVGELQRIVMHVRLVRVQLPEAG